MWTPTMARMPCACAVYCLRIVMTRLGSLSKRESAGIHVGNSRGQVIAVHHVLHPSLRGALVLVATVATTVMAMEIMAAAVAAMREVALPRWGNAMAMCDGDGTSAYMADNVGVSATAELTCGPCCGANEREPAMVVKADTEGK